MDKQSQSQLQVLAVIGVAAFVAIKYLGKGIKDSLTPGDTNQDTSEIVNISSQTGSPWSFQFWHNAPAGSLLLKSDYANLLSVAIANSVNPIYDDFSKLFGVFKRLETQSQVSFLSEYFSKLYGQDLLTWMIGDYWPNDRFSKEQVDQIIAYVAKLPKYKR